MSATRLRKHQRHLLANPTLFAADFAGGGSRAQKPSRQTSFPQGICGFSWRVLTLPSWAG